MPGPAALPVIDVGPLVGPGSAADRAGVADQIQATCRDRGFFYLTGHGVPTRLMDQLAEASAEFFALPPDDKLEIAMERGGRAWRGFFPVGAELTSGRPDLKEGLYFGAELPDDDPRVLAGIPLHGRNLFPRQVPRLGPLVLAYLDALTSAGQAVLAGVALSLGLDAGYFATGYTADPTILFRIFHYPPSPPRTQDWGVGERRWRSTRTRPVSFSSLLMCWLTADCVQPRARATALRLPLSYTLMNTRRSSSVMSPS
jgi:isopenicillin N synthase-like dioxygenase